MTLDMAPVLTDLPAGTGWYYGGFSYGLEPLTLPYPGAPDLLADYDTPNGYDEVCRQLHMIRYYGVPAGEVERRPADDGLYWFRWITGHQVSFIIWRMMAQLLNEVAEGRLTQAEVLRPLCHYVRGYCAMLLYTGSCPRSTYHKVIRPSMRLRHPSFSGSWAPDYGPVRDLFRARLSRFGRYSESADLLQAIRLHQLVHDGVAAKLVPDGKSLLRQSPVRRQDIRLLNLIFDNYFLTLRAPVSRHDVVAQLLRRVVAIVQDIAVNTLHISTAAEDGDLPEELRIAEVIACENSLIEIMSQVANSAAGLPADYAGERLPAGNRRSVSLT